MKLCGSFLFFLAMVAVGKHTVLGMKEVISSSLDCDATVYRPFKKHLRCTFRLANNGDDDISVSKWFTPLEGLSSDCLKVTRNGINVRYDGILMHRKVPPPEDSFVLIPAGDFVLKSFILSDGYNTAEPGEYRVSVDTFALQYDHKMPSKNSRVSLQSPQISFTVNIRAVDRKTTGQRHRISEELHRPVLPSKAIKVGQPLEPQYTGAGATTERKNVITNTHRASYVYVKASALEVWKDNAHFKLLFGNDLNNRQIVQDDYDKIVKALETKVFTYIIFGIQCRGGILAYTWHGATRIGLCKLLFDLFGEHNRLAPDYRMYSITGTLIHELSHAACLTVDVAPYGWAAAKERARQDPKKAIICADNYGYFSQTTYPFNFGIDAMNVLPNGNLYIIKDNIYTRLDIKSEDPFTMPPGYPKLIYNNWGKLTSDFNKGFDSIFRCGNSALTYATRGSKYIRYSDNSASKVDPGYPSPIQGNFGNLDPEFNAGFNSAGHFPNGITYVTKGNRYVKYKHVNCDTLYGGSRPIAGNWGNLPQAFNDGFDSMTSIASGKTFVTKGKQYVRYSDTSASVVDSGYPKSIRDQFGRVDYS